MAFTTFFLPRDYSAGWFSRFYNEQYLLMAYLLGGAGGDEIIMPAHFVQHTPVTILQILDPIICHPALLVRGALPFGGGFWLRRN